MDSVAGFYRTAGMVPTPLKGFTTMKGVGLGDRSAEMDRVPNALKCSLQEDPPFFFFFSAGGAGGYGAPPPRG